MTTQAFTLMVGVAFLFPGASRLFNSYKLICYVAPIAWHILTGE